jgi:hypothetical protein
VSLSKPQQNLLVRLLNKTENGSFSMNTFKALKRRGLVNENNLLTKSGRWRAIELIPLDEQCLNLSLELKNITVESLSNPEFQSFKWFKNKGCEGAYCEGGAILTILKALALNKLVELNTFKSRGDACKRFLEAQFTILKENKNEILESITLTTNKEFLDNFSEIISYTFVQEAYPGLTINFARQFLKAIERRSLVLVAEKLFESPYEYRKGWPDLTLVKNGEVKFIEVKTTDKLHQSQIQIFNQFRPLLPAQFEVLRLKKGT